MNVNLFINLMLELKKSAEEFAIYIEVYIVCPYLEEQQYRHLLKVSQSRP